MRPHYGYWLHIDRRDYQEKVVACLFTSKRERVSTVETYIGNLGYEPSMMPRGVAAPHAQWARNYTLPNGTMLTFWHDPSRYIKVTP